LFSNPFYPQIKQLAQVPYSLIWKFYNSNQAMSMHQMYYKISENGELSAATLWKWIEDNEMVGYSRSDISEIFGVININSNQKPKYSQFCQFWMACKQIFKSSSPTHAPPRIDQINQELERTFVQLFEAEQDNYREEVVTAEEIVKVVNLPNIEKVEYIIRSINYSQNKQGPKTGALNTQMWVSKSELKIMADKFRQKTR
jgi:hypothetical protein